MLAKPLCHLLMGPPGSGKSTLAQQLQRLLPQSQVVSTDQIRQQLYQDAAYQGTWADIEAEVLMQIQQAIALNQAVIYDATNAKPLWRRQLLQQLNPLGAQWVGWYLTTSLETCHQWNQQRDRTVPATVIDELYAMLQRFPPQTSEGFVAVFSLLPDASLTHLETLLQSLTSESGPESYLS